MGQFSNLVLVIVAINVILALFGIVQPEVQGNLIGALMSSNTSFDFVWRAFIDNLNPVKTPGGLITALAAVGALVAGLVTKRSDLIYAPLFIYLMAGLGIFNFISYAFPPSMEIIGIVLKNGMMFWFTWAGIEWLRGGE